MSRPDFQPKQTGAGLWRRLARWIDNEAASAHGAAVDPARIDWLRLLPFIAMHLMCLGVIWVGWSPVALGVAVALYGLRMFAITGFYHRYFSHRSFRTTRVLQFVFALLGATAAQRGPLWWAAHHRRHHARSDQAADLHSPVRHGFLWSHMGWFMAAESFPTDLKAVPDLARYPELRWLDRFDTLVPLALALALYGLGELLYATAPSLGTDGPQMLIWGFFVSTVVLYHVTYMINSVAHRFGPRRYRTRDNSRNNGWLALLTFGEGWHNNHHHYPGSARQGFYWWEIDITYYLLLMLARLGLIWDLRPVPVAVRDARRIDTGAPA